MAGARCSPPKGQSVKAHTRSRPRKGRKQTAASYYECFQGGRGCGTHHKNAMSAYRHSKRLDRTARKQGRRADWQPRKIG